MIYHEINENERRVNKCNYLSFLNLLSHIFLVLQYFLIYHIINHYETLKIEVEINKCLFMLIDAAISFT